MSWHCIQLEGNYGIAGLAMLKRIEEYMLALAASGRPIPDIAMFSRLKPDETDMWFFPPGTEEVHGTGSGNRGAE